jgi:hypothetical protein
MTDDHPATTARTEELLATLETTIARLRTFTEQLRAAADHDRDRGST